MPDTLSVGLVIFSKNEEKTIGELVNAGAHFIKKEDIFVIDGHSTDATADIVREKGVHLFLDSQKGKGSAIQLAINTIPRDILVFMDSDGLHQPKEIPLLLDAFLKYPPADMVIGSRFKGGSKELYGSYHEWMRLFGNILSTLIINLRWGTKLTDVQNGFRAVKTSIMQKLSLRENSFAIEQEMVMKCLKKRAKIVEIPSWELKRKYSNSHIVPFKMLPRYILTIIKNII